jgi:hypothetical protein
MKTAFYSDSPVETIVTAIDVFRTVSMLQMRSVTSPDLETPHPSASISMEDIFTNTERPILLGSYRWREEPDLREIDIFLEGNQIAKRRPKLKNCGSPAITVKRYLNHGISTANRDLFAQGSSIDSFHANGEPALENTWYRIADLADIRNHADVAPFLNTRERRCHYQGYEFSVFLCFRLPAGTVLPLEHTLVQDDNPVGHCTISRANETEFTAEYCRVDTVPYAHVPELVQLGWEFAGLKMKAVPELPDFCAEFDRELYLFALSVFDSTDYLQTIEDFDIICSLLEALKTSNYQWRTDFTVSNDLIRCLSDLRDSMMPSAEELDRFIKFKNKFRDE